MELYKRIKQRREELGMSQEELAHKLGYKSRSSVNKIELGINDIPQSKISAFASALDVSEAWLLGYDISSDAAYSKFVSIDTLVFEITPRSLQNSPSIFDAICEQVKNFSSSDGICYSDGLKKYSNVYEIISDPDITYDVKSDMLNAIIDIVLYDTSKNNLTVFISYNKSIKENVIPSLLNYFKQLNHIGQDKVLTYTKNLLSLQHAEDAATPTTIPFSGSRFELNAAREDPTASDEDRKAGDAIMTDDSEWE